MVLRRYSASKTTRAFLYMKYVKAQSVNYNRSNLKAGNRAKNGQQRLQKAQPFSRQQNKNANGLFEDIYSAILITKIRL